jgi:hypothetical protein
MTRHSRVRADSLSQYSRAVTALRSIALESEGDAHAPRRDRPQESRPNVRVLDEVGPGGQAHDRRVRASRRASRPDPELLARRPVIAQLPSVPVSRGVLGGKPEPAAG